MILGILVSKNIRHSLSASTVVGRHVCSRRPSRGVSGLFDGRRVV